MQESTLKKAFTCRASRTFKIAKPSRSLASGTKLAGLSHINYQHDGSFTR